MYKNWEITVWGIRGSAPAPFYEFMEYGGNTACISIRREKHIIVFDAGTGLAALARRWDFHQDMRLDIFISHLHIDHVIGLFSFQPLFYTDMTIHLYGRAGLKQKLAQLLSPPWWPLGMQDFKAQLYFHEIQPGNSFCLNSFTVAAIEGNHPGGSILYRLDGDEKRLVYALDYEYDETTSAKFSEFSYGSDLIIWDANFTSEDLMDGWGHSTWEQGVKAGHDAAAAHVLMTHYSHGYTDEFLKGQENACSDPICIFAKEGMEIFI